ncbi:MAG: hypothetical protein PHR26_02150 [Candidatus ainarchaeum sp.]|nr:hypothetical protein [Candidatus ainarchaeum sp.]MDD3975824.1 hypothetical protein [Candidatus ainarchaeum sp.]
MVDINSKNKIFFWIFGIIFSLIIFISINIFPKLNYIKNNIVLTLFIILIILILFFIIGLFSSKLPTFFYSFLFKKSTDFENIKDEVKKIETEKDLNDLVNRLKVVIKTISSNKYSKKAVDSLISVIGLDTYQAEKVYRNIFLLKRLKFLCILIGFIFSVVLYILLNNLDFFNFINHNFILIFGICFVVFILFFLEGILITRLPDSFYLSLININKDILINNRNNINYKNIILKKFEDKQKQNILEIKHTIKYLLKQGIHIDWIKKILKNYGLQDKIIDVFIDEAKNEILSENNNFIKKDINISDKIKFATLKLSLAKVHENFVNLKDIYSKISVIQKDLDLISKKQESLEKITSSNISKDFNDFIKKTNEIKKDDLKNRIPKMNINFKDKSKYKDYVTFLYNLILPHVSKYSEKELISIFLYEGYDYELIDDVIFKFKKNKIVFGKDKLSKSPKIIDFLNNFYEKVKKK